MSLPAANQIDPLLLFSMNKSLNINENKIKKIKAPCE